MEQFNVKMEHILKRLEIIENQLNIKTDVTEIDIKPTPRKKKYVCSSCDVEFKCGDICFMRNIDLNKVCINCRALTNEPNAIFLETKWPL